MAKLTKKELLHYLVKIRVVGIGCDWVKQGRTMFWFRSPPKVDKYAEVFKDVLPEIIGSKLALAIAAQEILKAQREALMILILDNCDQEDEWFFLKCEAIIYSEYFHISKWINYYLNLWHRIKSEDTNKPRLAGGVTDREIEIAKSCPIEKFYQGKLRKSGSRLTGSCPFHQDSNPSFFIFPDNNWHCFGCNQGGDSISFYMKQNKVNFRTAVRRLQWK